MRSYVLLSVVFLLLSVTTAAPEQPLSPPRLIVRGDDMGYAQAGNAAIMKCALEGIQTSIEVIVPSPWFPEAVKLLAEHPHLDVGVHLALSSEWDNVKWRPLTEARTLRDADGYFFPMIFPNKNNPKRSLRENNWDVADVEKEFRAQIELAKRKLPRISHLSSHMGCAEMRDDVKALTKKLAREYDVDVNLQELGVQFVGYNAMLATHEQRLDSFIKMLDGLQPGKTYLTVEHPGLDTPELRAIHHIGYENVATHRQGVTDLWTSPKVKEAIKTRNIQLISYKDLKK